MRVVPPENDTVEATWVAAWAYFFSWVRIAQLALRRGRHYWRLHISEQWLTAQLANVLAIADPAADPADPVALVRLARAIMTQEGGDRPPRILEGVAICTNRSWIPLMTIERILEVVAICTGRGWIPLWVKRWLTPKYPRGLGTPGDISCSTEPTDAELDEEVG